MTHYDPEIAPDPEEWLELDEQERIDLIEAYHQAKRIKLPNITVHAVIHSIVENQIAEGLEPVVQAMARLKKDRLTRHDALHAIGAVVAGHLFNAVKGKDQPSAETVQARYIAAVERLTAKIWRQEYGN